MPILITGTLNLDLSYCFWEIFNFKSYVLIPLCIIATVCMQLYNSTPKTPFCHWVGGEEINLKAKYSKEKLYCILHSDLACHFFLKKKKL